jgi:hypothetical protein
MILTFTPQAATAARHLIDNTSLAFTPAAVLWLQDGRLWTDDAWPFSSVERVLIRVLRSFQLNGPGFNPGDLTLLDERTASVVVEAIAMRAGIELTVAGKHKRVAS